jgi:hypothetical protein
MSVIAEASRGKLVAIGNQENSYTCLLLLSPFIWRRISIKGIFKPNALSPYWRRYTCKDYRL